MNTKLLLTLVCTVFIGGAAFAGPAHHRPPCHKPHRPEPPKVVRIIDTIARIVKHH